MNNSSIKPVESDIILIPTDFSEVADYAIQHAAHLAKIFKKNLCLFHVIESGMFDSDKKIAAQESEATILLEQKAKEINSVHGLSVTYLINRGSIFEEIGNASDSKNASLVIMGTHGVKGMQHVVGSKALRVILNANRPFVVVQKRSIRPHGYKNIVLPIDFSKETKQKLVWAAELSKAFKSTFHIFAAFESDEYANKAVNNNLAYAAEYLSDRGCDVLVSRAPKGDFSKETIRYAASIDADLIIIMTHPENDVAGFVFGADEQDIIANDAQIPVMTLNPVDTSVSVNGHLFNFSNF
jgi:nucleotide-binding universal stress UspA family protein